MMCRVPAFAIVCLMYSVLASFAYLRCSLTGTVPDKCAFYNVNWNATFLGVFYILVKRGEKLAEGWSIFLAIHWRLLFSSDWCNFNGRLLK